MSAERAGQEDVPQHVVFVTSGAPPNRESMSESTLRATAARILESNSRFLQVELRGGDPMANPSVARALVDLAREGTRGTRREVSIVVVTNLEAMTDALCDWLVEADVFVTIHLDGPREAHEANRALTGAPSLDVVERWIRRLHERFAARGITPEQAYLNAVVTVTRATLAAGAAAVVDACIDAGLVYVQLQPLRRPGYAPELYGALACTADEYLTFYREALQRIVTINEAGRLLVEKRLALHLEALGMRLPARTPGAEQLTYGHDGRVYAREVGPLLAAQGDDRFAIGHVERDSYQELARRAAERAIADAAEPAILEGCAACRYDRHCGSSLIRRYTMDDDTVTKGLGTEWCKTSMGTFDHIVAVLRSPEGASLRRVWNRWMAARDRVATRLRSRA